MSTRRADVLVVGAGPCGLSAAISAKFHAPELDVVVAEATFEKDSGSRAIILWPSTMEALHSIHSHTHIDAKGLHSPKAAFYLNGQYAVSADFDALESATRFPYINIITQRENEALLLKRAEEIGVQIIRGYKAVDLTEETGDRGGLSITFDNGQRISASHVIGADGSKSKMRELSSIPFTFYKSSSIGSFKRLGRNLSSSNEASYETNMLLFADVTIQNPECVPGVVNMNFGETGFNFLGTLPESSYAHSPAISKKNGSGKATVYRIAFVVRKGDEQRARDPDDFDYIASHVFQHLIFNHPFPTRSPLSHDIQAAPFQPLKVSSILWRSAFRIRIGIADSMHAYYPSSQSNLVLVGDAAHLQAPAGGQGQNLGIKEAIDAGRAIAAYHRDRDLQISAPPKIHNPKGGKQGNVGEDDPNHLRDLNKRRLKESHRIVGMTTFYSWFWTSQSWIAQWFRFFSLKLASFFPVTMGYIAAKVLADL